MSNTTQDRWFRRRSSQPIFWHSIEETKANITKEQTRMWANDQSDGRPAEYRWRPLFNAAVWPTPTTSVQCSNVAMTKNPLKFAGVPQTGKPISAILWVHVEEVLLFNKFFSDQYMP